MIAFTGLGSCSVNECDRNFPLCHLCHDHHRGHDHLLDVAACTGLGGSGPGIRETPGSSARFILSPETTFSFFSPIFSFLFPHFPLSLPLTIPHICHERQEYIRVNFFWLV